MKKYLFLLGFVLSAIGAWAQESLRREVDVTRDYEPSVQDFQKLGITPDMADTVQMRPDFEYQITPRPLTYDFSVVQINPASFSATDQASLPGYLRLGLGYPLQSSADVRYRLKPVEQVAINFSGSHYGRYGKIRNDLAIEEDATATDNRADVSVDYRPFENLFFQLDLGYDYRSVSRYGYYYYPTGYDYDESSVESLFDTSADKMRQNYRNLGAYLSVGTLDPRSPINVRLGVGVESFMDRYKYDQLGFDIDFTFNVRAGTNGRLYLDGETVLTKGRNNLKGVKTPLGRLNIAYEYRNDGLLFRLGGGFGYTKHLPVRRGVDSARLVFLPELILEKDLVEGRAIPFTHIRAEMTDNSYGALTRRNPYLYSGQYAPHTISYISRGGFRGTLGGRFKYTIYGGYTIQKDAAFWANAYSGIDSPANGASLPFYGNQGNVFTVLTDDQNYIEAGLDFQADVRGALSWQGALNWRSYSPDTFAEAWGLAGLTASTRLTYNHRERLYLSAGIEYTGVRQMYSLLSEGTVNELPGQADLSFGIDWFVNRQFGVFLQLNNLLDRRLYEFNHYPELGFNGMAGVKMSF